MSDVSKMAKETAHRYTKAIEYLDSCGELTREKFIKVHQIAGGEFSQSQLEQMWDAMEIKIAMEGDEELRQMLRTTFQKGAAVFGYTANGLNDLSIEKKPSQIDAKELSYEQLKALPDGQLVKLLSDESEKVRSHAVFALAGRCDKRAIEPLINKLKTGRFEERRLAAMLIVDYGDKIAIDPLINALQDEHEHVRYSAAMSLGNITDVRSIEPLRKLTRDSSQMVADAAKESLDKLTRIAESTSHETINGLNHVSIKKKKWWKFW